MTTRGRGPRFTVERVEAAWQVLLRDGDTVHAIPVVAEQEPEFRSGPGPGGLVWRPTRDGDVVGLESTWRGALKILQFASSQYALFHERAAGDWQVLALGGPDGLKVRAAEYTAAHAEVADDVSHPDPPSAPNAPVGAEAQPAAELDGPEPFERGPARMEIPGPESMAWQMPMFKAYRQVVPQKGKKP